MSASDISDYDFDSEISLSGDEDGDDVSLPSGSDLGDSDLDSDLGSDDEDSDAGSLGSDEEGAFADEYDALSEDSDDDSDDESEDEQPKPKKKKRKDEEAEYETAGRARWAEPASDEEKDHTEVGRLPIKLPTGEVQLVEGTAKVPLQAKKKAAQPAKKKAESEDESDDASDVDDAAAHLAAQPGRFGRMNIAEIVAAKGWKNLQRLAAAKEQLAQTGAEILGGGELVDVAPTITRMATFSLATVQSPDEEGRKLPVPASIRAAAFLSQLAVYKDLIPGYRIRALTAAEEAEKVRDEVRRMREGEKLLVRNYKTYLKALEVEVKGRTPLGAVALRCMCELLAAVPHFNFSENIMGVLVGRIGRRSWDADSELVLNTFVGVFHADLAATYSQALVKLIARMIKERKFQVHPNVLSCMLHLRLRTELTHMRANRKDRARKGKFDKRRGKGKDKDEGPKYKSEVRKKWQTKNQRKREKEMKEVEKEMAEAEAEVDQEEREQVQTETLKNLFVLYFSILKNPGRSPLLPAALEGISHFSHLINVDFFRDLLTVIRKIIADRKADDEEDEDLDPVGATQRVRIRMLGIVTAFDLLSGQGEALNIDLGDFVTELFGLLRPLSLDTGIEDPPLMTEATAIAAAKQAKGRRAERAPTHTLSTAGLLFRCLEAIFFPRLFASTASAPPLRAAAFGKRLVECALFFPPATAREAINFVRRLSAKEPKLANLLDTEERMFDGVYKPEMDDPQLTNPFTTSLYELDELADHHWDNKVRTETRKLRDANFV